MKSNFVLSLALTAVLTVALAGAANSAPEEAKAGQEFQLQKCQNSDFNVEFLCNPDWDVQIEKNSLFMIISSDPAVTITVLKTQSPFMMVQQINGAVLEKWEQYAEGYRKEDARFADQNSIVVKAFAKTYPEVRLLDYYTIYDKDLYNVLFSVNPRKDWDEYKFLIKRIADSFRFMN